MVAKVPPGVGPQFPQVVVLVGATGDLARRKLLPGLFHLASAGFIPGCRIIGVSLDDLDTEGFRKIARGGARRILHAQSAPTPTGRNLPPTCITYPWPPGPPPCKAAVIEAEQRLRRREPPAALLERAAQRRVVGGAPARRGRSGRTLAGHHGEALRHRSCERRGAERQAARSVRRGPDLPHRSLSRQGAGAEHSRVPLRQRPVRADLEPQLHRSRADRRARDPGPRQARRPSTSRPAPIATWWSPICFRFSASWPWSRRPRWSPKPISEEKNKVFRSMLPDQAAAMWCAASTPAIAPRRASSAIRIPRPSLPCKCHIDNWRWAGVPFYLRTGKRLAEGQRIISIAFREPPKSMFPAGSGVARKGPDHLTFDLADAAKMSLSFYGKRPGPGHASGQTQHAIRHA